MNLNNARYELTAVRPDQYPGGSMPEVAFVGRSNVGKSSIINALLNRKNLARVAATPGKTKEINFYNIDDVLYLVDLPGYGYASVSKDKKLSWGEVMETYLNLRLQLKLLVLLVDIRHKPSDDDRIMYDWICQRKVPHLVVATKLDKISRNQLKARLGEISATLGADGETEILPFSSETKQGRDELWARIRQMAGLPS